MSKDTKRERIIAFRRIRKLKKRGKKPPEELLLKAGLEPKPLLEPKALWVSLSAPIVGRIILLMKTGEAFDIKLVKRPMLMEINLKGLSLEEFGELGKIYKLSIFSHRIHMRDKMIDFVMPIGFARDVPADIFEVDVNILLKQAKNNTF